MVAVDPGEDYCAVAGEYEADSVDLEVGAVSDDDEFA